MNFSNPPTHPSMENSILFFPDGSWDGVRLEGTSIRRVCESFIKIWHQQPCQDFSCPPMSLPNSRQHWYSWNGVRWEGTFTYKCLWKFHQDLTSGTMSRLHLSSKSLPGVWEDMDIPDWSGDGVRWEGTSIGTVCESFIKIWHQEPCQDSTCPPSHFLESGRTWTFLMDLEMVSDGREHPSEAFVKVSSRSNLFWLI